MRTVRLFPWE